MLVDLLSPNNYINFNIKLANSIGLHPAIYLSELISIYEKANRKNVVNDNFVSVDRIYIKRRTTLDISEQREIDSKLMDLNIIKLKSSDKDSMIINLDSLIGIVSAENEQTIQRNINSILAKNATTRSKPECVASGLMTHITSSDNKIREGYYKWMLSAIARYGYINKPQVLLAQEKLSAFANGNVEVLIKLLEIATLKGYNNMEFIIKIFNDKYASEFRRKYAVNVTNEQPIGDEEY